ncbi:MAG TPA: family 16 glycosylhydrolase, partial [Myxococcota bacterium]|nr:family 16 glycosylhydrolase [Myxococcota bacterium]
MLRIRSAILPLVVLGSGAFLPAAGATTCSGVELFSKSTVRFGRWEIRMQPAASPGTVSSFFTYNNDSYLGGAHPWREIDIEVLGSKPTYFQSNLITGSATEKVTTEKLHSIADMATTFHTFVLEWTPDSIVWRVDGVRRRKIDGTDPQVVDLSDSSQTWRMNLWASSSEAWAGKLDLAKLPVAQVVNWMRYSRYTPG